jgi:hypothetical protein
VIISILYACARARVIYSDVNIAVSTQLQWSRVLTFNPPHERVARTWWCISVGNRYLGLKLRIQCIIEKTRERDSSDGEVELRWCITL